MKRALLSLLAVTLLLGVSAIGPDQARAAEPAKPLAVMAFSGYNEWYGDIEYVGSLAENPDLAKGLEAMLKLFTHNRGLQGLDKARPWGAVVQTDGTQFPACGLIPVTDLDKLITVAKPLFEGVEKSENGVYKIQTKEKPLYVKQEGTWAIVADKPEALTRLPTESLKEIGKLHKQYDLAVRLYVANVPEAMRKKLLEKMRKDSEKDQAKKPDESEDEHLIRKEMIAAIQGAIIQASEEIEHVTVGWALDREAEKTYLDLTVTAIQDTTLAGQFAKLGKTKTRFGGFRVPGAALTANWTGQCDQIDADKVGTVFKAIRRQAFKEIDEEEKPEEEKKLGKQLVGDLLDVVRGTIASGHADGGLSVLLKPDALTVVSGCYVSDADKLEAAGKKIAHLAQKENPAIAAWIKLDAGQYKEVRFHTISVPIPDDADNRETVVKLLGETLDVVVGMGKESLYVAAGRDALKTLKQAIAKSAEESFRTTSPLQVSVAVKSVADFLSVVGEEKDRPGAAKVAAVLEKVQGKDHLNLAVRPVDRGVRLRLEVEEGILRLLGQMTTWTEDDQE